MAKEKNLSLRDAVHKLENKHHLCILGPGLIREMFKELVDKGEISVKDDQVSSSFCFELDRLEQVGKEAHAMLTRIKPVVYKNIDPDKEIVDITGVEED